jgi:peroxiredoxin
MRIRYIAFSLLFFLLLTRLSSASISAPDFSLHGEGDAVYRLFDYKGKDLILFFFSFSCGHCKTVTPIVNELYKKSSGRYEILGIVFGTPREDLGKKRAEAGIEFPLAIGTKEISKDYKVHGTPYIWIIGADGRMKERFVGKRGAELLKSHLEAELNPPSPPLLKGGFLAQRVGLFELSSDPKSYEGKIIETGGLLIQASPAYFPKPVFMLTNGADRVRVSAWLPLEVAPSPKGLRKQRKKVMSDFLDKYVIISGKVVLEDGRPLIEVKDARTE